MGGYTTFFSWNPMRNTFRDALKIMRTFGEETLTLPWIVMMGEKHAGKTAILQSLEKTEHLTSHNPSFWRSPHGIIVEIDGTDNATWTTFLSLLTRYRPKRPLEAVILTLPASELLNPSADIMQEKLRQMHLATGLHIPIYILISKCDLIPGFEDFCKALPRLHRADMFGWSNDKESATAQEAFTTMDASLTLAQQEIFATGCPLDKVDGVFIFPTAFHTLKKGLQIYTDTLLNTSELQSAFFLRGIYFVGDSHAQKASRDTAEEEKKRTIYFVKDLFENKIFREKGLAYPIKQKSNYCTKVAIALIAVLGTLTLLKANQNLQRTTHHLMAALPQMTKPLLQTIPQTKGDRLFSPILIPSWFSTLDARIHDVMIMMYDKIIFRAIANKLESQAKHLVTVNEQPLPHPTHHLNPLNTEEFHHLNRYVNQLDALQLAAHQFNALGKKGDTKGISKIIAYLFHDKVPDAFFRDNPYYMEALNHMKIKRFNFEAYKKEATLKLQKLFEKFQATAFNPNARIPGLAHLMVSFQEGTTVDRKIEDVLTNLEQTLSDPALHWLNQDQFQPGPSYEALLQKINASDFFNEETRKELIATTNQKFLNFRRRLAEYAPPFLNGQPLFAQDNGLALAAPSTAAINLKNGAAGLKD